MRTPLLLAALLLPLVPDPARAVESAPVETPRSRAVLVSEAEALAPGVPFRLALRLALAPGWHSYWVNPGDAGAPAEVALERGGEAGPLAFPPPERIPYGPLVNFGHTGEATFTLSVSPPPDLAPGGFHTVEARASWLACAEVCVPEEGLFRLDLPVEAAPRASPPAAALFAAADAAAPRPAPAAVSVSAGFEGARGALRLEGPGLPGRVREAFLFPEASGLLDHAAPQTLWVGADGALRLALDRGHAPAPARLEGVLRLVPEGGSPLVWRVSAPLGPVPEGGPPTVLPLWQAILWGALGGLILNLMPCVFPVLAMKGVALARLSGAARGAVRREALGYAAGVVLAFLALGAALVGLRGAGAAAGWGFQLTHPAAVALLAWVMLGVGLNLSGAYAVPAPRAGRGGAGSLGAGALAVVVATPCTAPFLAAALAAGLALPPAAGLAVFAAVGLGMALPGLALAAAPGLAALLPRPGPWMERLRGLLAFPMYAAAAWLAWVVSVQAGPDGVMLVLAGAVLLGLGAWALGTAQRAGAGGWGRRAVPAAALLAALALLPGLGASEPPVRAASAAAWSPERVAALRAEGRPVFVNLTAAWCLTCRVNERVALASPAVLEAFARGGVAVLEGDWTRGDPAISALLRAEGREGVPLYLLYPAGGGGPRALPPLLTPGLVLEALREAGVKHDASFTNSAAYQVLGIQSVNY